MLPLLLCISFKWFLALVLPVLSIVPQLIRQLALGDAILVAPPGAGKSTCLPLKLLSAAEFTGQRIIMLQPRRIAARSIATYLANQLGEGVGQTVGYRIRGESKVSANTRLEVVTEGLLTRMLQSNPELPGVGLVIFDEFHERNLHADFSLALCLEVQQALRDDLRLLVMSATLEVSSLQVLMPQAKVLQSEGKSFPVEMFYQPLKAQQPLIEGVLAVINMAVEQQSGSILVFLPGAWEINQLFSRLNQIAGETMHICPLYGELNKTQQMTAIEPAPPGHRKIVLATNIAETSLTIDGIKVVIDSGQEKIALFNLSKGITQLKQQPISQASATQRAGRAGRLGPGICYRLWGKDIQSRLAKHSPAQILNGDICALVLNAAVWGTSLNELALLDRPSIAQFDQAQNLLIELQALDCQGKATLHGRAMSLLPCHPRLANMLLRAKDLGDDVQLLACMLAALLEDKDILPRAAGASLTQRIDFLQTQLSHPLWKTIRLWEKRIGIEASRSKQHQLPVNMLAVLVAMAFPDHLAKNRGNGSFLLANGAGALLSAEDPLANAKWLAVGQLLLTENKADAKIAYAEEIDLALIKLHFDYLISQSDSCQWQSTEQRIVAKRRTMLGAISLQVHGDAKIDPASVEKIWCDVIGKRGVSGLPWCAKAISYLNRVRMARELFSQNKTAESVWPDMSNQWLEDNLAIWLAPYLVDLRCWSELEKLDWLGIIKNQLDWAQQSQLDKCLPSHFCVPSGSNIPLIYQPDGTVRLAVRMQEVYGMSDTPTVGQGKRKVLMELLSPASRPLQKTQDLAGFWAGSYKQIQKEMKGRYPRHFWPDDPANATATSKTKKKMLLENEQKT